MEKAKNGGSSKTLLQKSISFFNLDRIFVWWLRPQGRGSTQSSHPRLAWGLSCCPAGPTGRVFVLSLLYYSSVTPLSSQYIVTFTLKDMALVIGPPSRRVIWANIPI